VTDLRIYRDVFEAMVKNDEDFVESGKRSMQYYTGGFGEGQWDKDDLDKLKAEKRPPLQLNIILPKVNMVVGVEQQQRTYWKASAVGLEDEDWSQLATPLLLHVERQQNLERKFSRMFKNGAVVGRDWLEVIVERGNDFDYDISVERESWYNVHIDPEARTDDTSKWHWLARSKWFTIDELHANYPETLKYKTVRDFKNDEFEVGESEEMSVGKERGDFYEQGDKINWTYYVDESKQRIRVVEMWEREWFVNYVVLSPEGVKVGDSEDKEEAEAMAASVGGKVVHKADTRIWHLVYSGKKELSKRKKSPYWHKEFPLVPFFYYYEDMGDGIETFGMVENLKHPQNEKNKRRSQALDILNRSPKGGGVITDDAGISAEALQEASSSGKWAFLRLRKGRKLGDVMMQWAMNHLPILGYIANLEERSEFDAKEISGAVDPLMGKASSSKESGFAAQTRIKQGLLTMEEPLNNLDFVKKKILKMIMSNIQQYWTPEKIRRVIGMETENAASLEEAKQMDAQIDKFIREFKNRRGMLKYDIRLTKSESPTVKSIKFREIAELIKMVPAYAPALLPELVRQSDWESKEEVLNKIEQVALEQQLIQMAGQTKGET
jgi:hypothetical protein